MKKILYVILSSCALLPALSFADDAGQVTVGGGLAQVQNATNLPDLLNGLFTLSLEIGGALAVLRIAYAGYLYMGTDMWSKKSDAKHILSDAVVGLLLLLAVWLILNQINPDILNLNILRSVTSSQ